MREDGGTRDKGTREFGGFPPISQKKRNGWGTKVLEWEVYSALNALTGFTWAARREGR